MTSPTIACCAPLLMALVAAPLFAIHGHARPASAAHHARHEAVQQRQGAEGERIFEQNCARCHNAPDGFSPRITATIVRHMRVRANLSQHDEQILLHYFNQ